MTVGIAAAEHGWLPDWVVRMGIRRLLRRRLRDQASAAFDGLDNTRGRHIARMRENAIAQATQAANAQHYQLPAAFFRIILGPRLKYSCGWWPDGVSAIDEAEDAMLRLTAERAVVVDGMRVLDLGCGWGAWALWVAETFPAADVVAVSNADAQRRYIDQAAAQRGLRNVTAITADINTFAPDGTFDRIVSVEMFEHLRNYEQLLTRIDAWLRPAGTLFVHLFCHRRFSYFFEDAGDDDWMAHHFFTGGMMPADDLLPSIDGPLTVDAHWRVNGQHYQRTLQAWLARLDRRRDEVDAMFRDAIRTPHPGLETERWRLFLLACAELFGYARGQEWFVSHYRLSRKAR